MYDCKFKRQCIKVKKSQNIIDGRNFVIISSIDWSEIRQMPQQLATSLVESGHRVLFIENTGVRAPRMADVSRIGARIRNWLKGTRGFFDVQENLTAFSPLFIPLPYSRLVLVINQYLLSSSINNWMRSGRFYNPIVITFLPTPLANSIVDAIDPALTIYYCANDMAGGSPGAAALRPYEDLFFSRVDAVFCNSTALKDKADKFSNKTYLFPAGVDFAKFETARINAEIPDDLKALKRPIVGYIGAISGVFDQELVIKAARALPDVYFVLVGPLYTDVSLLNTCPNIKLFGQREHDDVPAYIKGFNVALIPYVKNTFTDAVYSCKLNEYLAMGVPVVATDLRELLIYVEKHGNVLETAKTSDEFVFKLREALDQHNHLNQAKRISASRVNSWDSRFKSMYEIIQQLLIQKNDIKLDWQSRLANQYRQSQAKIIRLFFVGIACYLLIFNTPLIWFAGDQLAVRHTPKVADAIVIFSGDGESSYINQSYQRRTLDAIRYFKSGYAPLIILSSGKDQLYSEVEMIKSLLIERGIPEQAIQMVQKYPRSTFENVALVEPLLAAHRAKSILLVTSPYHSRRALWVWRKAMPKLVVLAPPVVDTPQVSPQWNMSLDQIRVICYEYAAITYYWWKGWV